MRRCSESAASPRPRSRRARGATRVAVGLAAVMCGVLASCSGPIDIGGKASDLMVSSPSVSDSPKAGAPFTLSATVRNAGDGAAAATTLRYYRSADATITRADTEVGTDAVAELAAGGSGSQSVDLTAPATPGTYHYGACVDAVTDESDTTNNCSASVQVTVPEAEPEPQRHADLLVMAPSVSDGRPAAAAGFTLSATVRNDGEGVAEATTLRYYRSSDATITRADTEVGTDVVAELAASATSSQSVDLAAPATPGTYHYGACVDAVTDEADTANNCSASVQVTVPAPRQPDLTVTSPSVSDRAPAAGAAFTVSATVRNDGDGAAGATTLRYYRSSDATITTADTEVGTDVIAGLAASGSAGASADLTAPATPGPYYYGACVDAVTGESDTTNNCSASVEVTVPAPRQPDLTVTSPSVSDGRPAAGASFTLSATVRNDGEGAAEATALRYYRSSDATITTADTEVGTDAIAGLAASGSAGASVELTAPSTPGPYYYGACADAVTDESDTTNNCSASVQITVPDPTQTSVTEPQGDPDLTVTSPSVSDSGPVAGASFTLSATVRNAGDGAAEATTLRYYRSTDATITTSDLEVGTDAIAGLAASGSAGASVDLTAPSTPGPYYYGACADAVTDESDTTNNCSGSVQVTVPEPRHPDLTVTSPSVSDRGPAAGATFTLSATVRNAGHGAAEATTLRYYRSTDATITTADTEVGTDEVAKLAASATSGESVELTAPSTPGPYYYGACVDAVTDESDTTNNCSASAQVTVPAPKPDLMVGSPTVDESSPATGATFTLSATVRNAGAGEAASTTLRYYRSTDATITTSDTQVGTDEVAKLAASATSDESVELTAPSTPGPYYYGACVDAVTGESDTTNNCSASVQVTVPAPKPDLVVGSPTVDKSSPAAGAAFTLSVTVRNAGDAEAASTTLRYYRSTDATITTDDTEVGTDDSIDGLAATGTSSRSVALKAPETSGTYYYGACVDAVTGESDTANNCSTSVQVTVQGAQPQRQVRAQADLVVGSPTVDKSSPATGATFTLSATVRNAGAGEAASTTLRYYRSTDATITADDTQVGTDEVAKLAASATSDESVELTAPATSGTYYYGACVDAVTDESDTANNCSTSVQVTVQKPADLVVGPPTVVQRSLAAGMTLVMSVTVRNAGAGEAASTTLRYYRSTDATITTDDILMSTAPIDGLAATGTIIRSVALTLHRSGTYYVGACVDAVTDESDTANNCSTSVQVTVQAQPQRPVRQPDLVVASSSVSVRYPGVGEQFTLSATVRNAGDVASAATTLRYYRSPPAGRPGTAVGTDAVAALAASKSRQESVDVTAPSTPGTYLYQACVDAVANESDVTNNCGSHMQVRVLAKPVATVELTPDSVSFGTIGATRALTMSFLDSDGDAVDADDVFSLSILSADSSVATVSRGIGQTVSVTAIGRGKTAVGVTANDVMGTATVTVDPTGPRVEVSPRSWTFTALGDSKTVTVRVLDENSAVDADASYSFLYSGRTVGVERVTGGLQVTANEVGGAKIEVLSAGATSAILLVRAYQQPASVKISPSSANLEPGETEAMSVRVMDANGHDITVAGIGRGGRVVYWETSNSAVATVAGERRRDGYETGATATVTAVTAGTATITARPGGETVEGTATITVATPQ